mmetsp:Transcript_6708/g.11902  ORF Transcript_6708/g.11902 Transcript_6708/m.11902 type:complete len:793 (+) Transcript_6708:3340-5718(+)
MASRSVSKEIHPGIHIAIKQVSPSSQVWEVRNAKTEIMDFTVSFAASKGVKLQESETLDRTVEVHPGATVLLATLELKPDSRVAQQFRFVCRPPSREQAQALVAGSMRDIPAKAQACFELISRKPVNSLKFRDVRKTGSNYVDPHFVPGDFPVFGGSEVRQLDTAIHWRRPSEFMQGEYAVFHGAIEPNDIKQGKLGDCWFMCALSALAERPDLVKRLFLISEANAEGIYRVRFCKDGEWIDVTIDDYFPCFPNAGPIFSRSQGNELWVLLLEKAYAKIHGSYMLLRGGWAAEGMSDLTGCPTENIEFEKEDAKRKIAQDKLWPYLLTCDVEGALISASTRGEDRWTETGGPSQKGGLVPGHAYTVIAVKEACGFRLLNIRNPWGTFEWNGNWSDTSPLWTKKMRDALNPNLNENDGTFWMSFDDFLTNFSGVNICHVRNYEEARMKGLFRKELLDGQDRVTAQWFYSVTTKQSAKVFIGLHQNDERMLGVESKRSYLDLGLVVFEKLTGGELKIVHYEPSVCNRQVEVQVTFEPGRTYYILPRTTGCALQRPAGTQVTQVPLLQGGTLSPMFVSTLVDLFRKANVMLGEDLSIAEFTKLFGEAGVSMSVEQATEIFNQYVTTDQGLTLDGFVHYIHNLLKKEGEPRIYQLLQGWGYDRDLFSFKSRHFILTLHSDTPLGVHMHKARGTEISQRVDEVILQSYGVKKSKVGALELYCLYESIANCFTYGVYNTTREPKNCVFDLTQSRGVVYGTGAAVTRHHINPSSWEILNYMQIAKDSQNASIRPQLRLT